MSEQPPTEYAPPGWFPDPTGLQAQRWWDGTQWGQQTRPRRDPCPERGTNRSLYFRRRLMVSSHASLHSPLIRSTVRLRDNRRTGTTGSLGRLPDILVGPLGSRGRSATRY